MSKFLSLLLFLNFLSSSVDAQTINKNKSVVEFEIANMYVNTVTGTFCGFSGDVKFDIHHLNQSKINICIDASSVNTGNEKRDNHLKTNDFFEVEKYPEICFISNKLLKTDEGFSAEGTLKMHGIQKSITIPLQYEKKLLKSSFTINRFDYNIGNGTGTFLIDEEVLIVVSCYIE